MRPATRALPLAVVLLIAAAGACADVSGPTPPSPLAGLVQSSPQDSAGNPTTPPPGTLAPGYFRGTVRAPNAPGAVGDTLAAGTRIAGVLVRAYPVSANTTGGMQLGNPVGSTTTNAQGDFTFPTIPGGDYAITFTPPPGSGYVGVWVTAFVHGTSHEFPWWVTLPRS